MSMMVVMVNIHGNDRDIIRQEQQCTVLHGKNTLQSLLKVMITKVVTTMMMIYIVRRGRGSGVMLFMEKMN